MSSDEDNPLQKALDDAKAALLGSEKERDAARAETAEVKKTGEKVLDENAALSRSVDDLKKNVSDLIKGRPPSNPPVPSPAPGDDKDKKESIGAWATRWMDKAWHFPYVPPEKETKAD